MAGVVFLLWTHYTDANQANALFPFVNLRLGEETEGLTVMFWFWGIGITGCRRQLDQGWLTQPDGVAGKLSVWNAHTFDRLEDLVKLKSLGYNKLV